MEFQELMSPLRGYEIEARVGQVDKERKKFSILLYVTYYTAVKRMNQVFRDTWGCSYFFDDKQNLVCEITVNGISRSDIGTPPESEKIKQEIRDKGEYTDAFKRACGKWGIGIELKEQPFIYMNSWKHWDKKNNPTFYQSNARIEIHDETKGILGGFTLFYNKDVIFEHIVDNYVTRANYKNPENQDDIPNVPPVKSKKPDNLRYRNDLFDEDYSAEF